MKFKRYLEKIQKKIKEVKPDIEENVVEEVKPDIEENVVEEVKPKGKKILGFVDRKKDPHQYLKRYIKEENYRNWFNRNYSNYTIYEAVGLTASDYIEMKRELAPESEHTIEETQPKNEKKHADKTYFKPTYNEKPKTNFDEFIDGRLLISHNAFGDKEMKIKVLEVSDETAALVSKFGDRLKINKILVTIKHLKSQQVEEGEFDIEAIENELVEKRHYSSANRWVPIQDIKNGYITNTRHTMLISDAAALDYILF